MTDDLDQRQRLKAFFSEVHAAETPPPLERLLAGRKHPGAPIWKWATTIAVLALLVGWAVWAVRLGSGARAPEASPAELALARSLSDWQAPLDFLLETPGSELVHSLPRLSEDWIRLPEVKPLEDKEAL